MYYAKYNKDKSNALHVHMFNMMERIREVHPDFYYGLRSANNNNRMEDGILFQGNRNYAFAPLVTEGSSCNRTNCVGLSIKTDGEEYRCYIEIVYDKDNNKKPYYDTSAYLDLAKKLGCRSSSWNPFNNKIKYVKSLVSRKNRDVSKFNQKVPE